MAQFLLALLFFQCQIFSTIWSILVLNCACSYDQFLLDQKVFFIFMLLEKSKFRNLLKPHSINLLARKRYSDSYEGYSKLKLKQQQFIQAKNKFDCFQTNTSIAQSKKNVSEHHSLDVTECQPFSQFVFVNNFKWKKTNNSFKNGKMKIHPRGCSLQYDSQVLVLGSKHDISSIFSNSLINQKISRTFRANKKMKKRVLQFREKQNEQKPLKKKIQDYGVNYGTKSKISVQQI